MVKISVSLSFVLVPSLCLGASVQDVLQGRPELTTFTQLTTRFPALLTNLTNAGGTLLAPTNDAMSNFFSSSGVTDVSSVTEASASDILSYHILPLALKSTDLGKQGGALADTSLLSSEYSNLAGSPNVVFASNFGSTGQDQASSGLKIYSGVGNAANVTTPDLAFDNGYLHIIDNVLNLPQNCTQTAESTASLSTLLTALEVANLTQVVDTMPKFTCLAPNDAAFQAAGIDVKSLNVSLLSDTLKYHTIVGNVGYSTALEDGMQYETLYGVNVTVHKKAGQFMINNVGVLQGNVIMNNGVAHVLGGLLTLPSAPAAPGPRTTITSIPAQSTGTSPVVNSKAQTLFEHGVVGLFATILIAFASGFLFI